MLVSTSHLLAADTAQDLQINYVDFRKGLNTKNSDFLLDINEGVIYDNIALDVVEGALKKRESVLTAYTSSNTDVPTSIHRLYLSDGTKLVLKTGGDKLETCDDSAGTCSDLLTLSSSGYKYKWVTSNDLAYGTDGYNSVIKTNGTDATYLGSAYAEDAGSGAGPDGTYTYKISFYTTSYEVGWEVASNTVVVTDNDINLTWIPIAPSTYLGESVTGRKVYRTSDGGSDYKLLSNGTIANNTATTLTDSDTDAARGAAYPTVDDTCTPPKTLLIHSYEARLFLGNNPSNQSRLYWSELNRPEVFYTDQYADIRLNDGDQLTVIGTWLSNFVISKDNSWQYLDTTGATPLTDWSVSDVYTPKGCRSIYSAVMTHLGWLFLAGDGIYLFNGQYSLIKSKQITPTIESIDQNNRDNVYADFTNNKYYLTYADSTEGTSTNNKTLVYDVLTEAYTIFTLGFSCFDVFSSGSDDEILYGGSMTNGNIYGLTEAAYQILHKTHDDFSGTFTAMRYLPTRWGADDQNAELEISRTATIDELTGTIDNLTGIIDREVSNGSYLSQYLTTNASSFGKFYWNESIPSQGGNVLFYLRSAATTTDTSTASWSGPYSNPAGTDVSGATCSTIAQYKIEATADSIAYSPTLYSESGHVVKLTYNKTNTVAETSIPMHYKSGWEYMKAPGYNKELTYLEAEFEGEGEFDVIISNEFGQSETFTIDMDTYTNGYYKGSFSGIFVAKRIQIEVTKDDLSPFVLKRLGIIHNVDRGSVTRIENGI